MDTPFPPTVDATSYPDFPTVTLNDDDVCLDADDSMEVDAEEEKHTTTEPKEAYAYCGDYFIIHGSDSESESESDSDSDYSEVEISCESASSDSEEEDLHVTSPPTDERLAACGVSEEEEEEDLDMSSPPEEERFVSYGELLTDLQSGVKFCEFCGYEIETPCLYVGHMFCSTQCVVKGVNVLYSI